MEARALCLGLSEQRQKTLRVIGDKGQHVASSGDRRERF